MQIQYAEPTDPALPNGHAHAADLEACLDLINSEEYSDGVAGGAPPDGRRRDRLLHDPRTGP